MWIQSTRIYLELGNLLDSSRIPIAHWNLYAFSRKCILMFISTRTQVYSMLRLRWCFLSAPMRGAEVILVTFVFKIERGANDRKVRADSDIATDSPHHVVKLCVGEFHWSIR